MMEPLLLHIFLKSREGRPWHQLLFTVRERVGSVCGREHSNFVNCVRFSPDGSLVLSVSSDKKGFLFNGQTGEKVGELSSQGGHAGSIYAASWSPDSKHVRAHTCPVSAGPVPSATIPCFDMGPRSHFQLPCHHN